jgi:hypothetical protein
VRVPAREEEPPEQRLRVGAAQAGRGHRRLQHGPALVQLGLVLGEVGRLDAVPEPHLAGRRVAPAEQRLQHRRLARAVGTDQRHVLAALQRDRGAVQQLLLAGAHVEPLRVDHDPAAPRRLEELEAERAPRARAGLDLVRPDAVDLLLLRLGLLGLRVLGAEALDEALQARDVLRLPRRLLLEVQRPRRLLAPPDVPLAGEEHRAPAVELEHRGRHRLEEPAVVRDEDHGRVDRLQQLLEPLDRLDVEVVRRLVEQQQVGLRRERAGERRARQLAAREGRERPVEVVVGEAEAADDARRAVAPVVAARVLEPCLRRGVTSERAPVVVAAGHRRLQLPQLRLDRCEVGRPGQDVIAQRPSARGRRTLVVQRDPRALLEGELAALERRFAVERAQQRRLPGAVGPGERQPVAPLHLERHAVEERRAVDLLAEVGCDQDRHGHVLKRVPVASRASPTLLRSRSAGPPAGLKSALRGGTRRRRPGSTPAAPGPGDRAEEAVAAPARGRAARR